MACWTCLVGDPWISNPQAADSGELDKLSPAKVTSHKQGKCCAEQHHCPCQGQPLPPAWCGHVGMQRTHWRLHGCNFRVGGGQAGWFQSQRHGDGCFFFLDACGYPETYRDDECPLVIQQNVLSCGTMQKYNVPLLPSTTSSESSTAHQGRGASNLYKQSWEFPFWK